MKKYIMLLFFIPLFADAQVTLDWLDFDEGISIATDAVDNVYTVYWTYAPGGDIFLSKRDSDGNFIWESTYNNLDDTRHEVATWVETDNENNIIVTGTIRSGYASPVDAASVIMKFNPEGTLLWRVVYETAFDGSYTKKCLIDADNNIYVLGMGSGPTGFVTKVKKFAPDGTALWNYFNGAGIGAAQNFKFTPDNKILISGRGIIGSVNGYAKIDLAGNELWSYAGVLSLTAGDAAGDAFGNTYIINGEYVAIDPGSILTKLTPTGTVIWNDVNDITATKVEVGTDNNSIVAGFPNSGSGGVAMIKYDQLGNIIWQNLDADGPGYNLLLHAMMKLDIANNAYFAAGTLFEMAICKVNADGSNGWIGTCTGGYSNAFVFGNDYSIYLVGGSIAHFIQDPIITCDAPSGLFTNNITINTARVNWTPEPGAFQYEVWYKKVPAATWKKKFVPGIKNKLNLKNLQCNKNYMWQIRTICDTVGVDIVSAFSPVQYFTTAACRTDMTSATNTEMLVYPNPAFKMTNIILPETGKFTCNVMDLTGKIVYNEELFIGTIGESKTLNLQNLPSGIYLIHIYNDQTRYIDELILEN